MNSVLFGRFVAPPLAPPVRSAPGSIVHLLVRINTLVHSFRTVFLLFLRNTVFTRGTRTEGGAAL